MPDFDVAQEFRRSLDEAIAETVSPFPKDDWLAAGYRPRQDEEWWRDRGPGMVSAFIEWYESQPDITIWRAPDGRPAIELDMTVMFDQVPVKMAPDVVLKAGTALMVVDFKSGANVPGRRQLGLYACGIERTYGIRPKYGTLFMARGIGKKDSEEKTYLLPPIDLGGTEFSYPYFCKVFAQFDRAVNEEIFIANPGDICKMCAVNRACSAFGGEQAPLFDTTDPRFRKGR